MHRLAGDDLSQPPAAEPGLRRTPRSPQHWLGGAGRPDRGLIESAERARDRLKTIDEHPRRTMRLSSTALADPTHPNETSVQTSSANDVSDNRIYQTHQSERGAAVKFPCQ